MSNKQKIVIAMSGGVDSSVAAAVLKEQGYDVIGISLQLWNYSSETDNRFGTCCSLDDLSDARRVADKLNIPFYIFNMEEEFKKGVVDYFVDEYLKGRTPIPCTLCNSKVKFEELLIKANRLGCDKVATGHYASLISDDQGRLAIRRGQDTSKDQSYFLFDLKPHQISRVLFPLSNMVKKQVREMAEKLELPVVANKPESQEICFIQNNDYADFLAKQVGESVFKDGPIVDSSGKVLGTHKGYAAYTIGQRKGLNLGGLSEPLFVTKIDAEKNRVTVGTRDDVFSYSLKVNQVNWYWKPDSQTEAEVQIRNRHQAAPAIVIPIDGDRAHIKFAEKQSAVTPGQAAVFYQDNIVIGGGWIE